MEQEQRQIDNHGSSVSLCFWNAKQQTSLTTASSRARKIPSRAEASWAEATRPPKSRRFPAEHRIDPKDQISAAKGFRNRVTHPNDNSRQIVLCLFPPRWSSTNDGRSANAEIWKGQPKQGTGLGGLVDDALANHDTYS